MRYIIIIGDGIADRPLSILQDRTPLEYVALPGMARLGGQRVGRARTVPEGCPAGSDTAILSIFGFDPRVCYTGRAALEAAGAGVTLRPGETAWRTNLVTVEGEDFETAVMRSHNGTGIGGDEALQIVRTLQKDTAYAELAASLGFVLHESPTFRQMGVARTEGSWGKAMPGPHDHLGKPIGPLMPEGDIRRLMAASFRALRGQQANCIWPWAPGSAMELSNFTARYGHRGPVVSAVPLVKGIAALCGLPAPEVVGATGELDTNYQGKVDAALEGLRAGADFAVIHVEAPDEMSHAKDVEKKLEALRRLDCCVIVPLLDALDAMKEDYRILFLSDHPTLVETGAHNSEPVPYCIYDSRKIGTPRVFCEANAATGDFFEEGTELIAALFSE